MGVWSALTRRSPGTQGRVIAHILDPIAGYSNRDLEIGRDIDADAVRRLGDRGEVFLVVAYDGGVPSATLCSRHQWLRARARLAAADEAVDTTVWRKREELRIG